MAAVLIQSPSCFLVGLSTAFPVNASLMFIYPNNETPQNDPFYDRLCENRFYKNSQSSNTISNKKPCVVLLLNGQLNLVLMLILKQGKYKNNLKRFRNDNFAINNKNFTEGDK